MSSCLRHSAPSSLKRGIIQSTPHDSDKVVERELIQCCHCQFTQVWAPGVEKGWRLCQRCMDWHCPKHQCHTCRPIKQWLENMAKGISPDHVPVVGRVEADPPKD